MQESLKTGRNIHRVLVGVCAAIMLFGLSPSRTDIYESAVTELEVLRDLDDKSLLSEVHGAVKWEFRKYDLGSMLKSRAEGFFMKIAGELDLDPAAIFPFIFEGLPMDAPLSEIESYFTSRHPVYVFKPDQEDWDKAIGRAVYSFANKHASSNKTIEAVSMKDPDALDEFIKRSSVSPGDVRTWPDSFLRLSIAWSDHRGVFNSEQRVRGRFKSVWPKIFQNWFESQEEAKVLIREIEGDMVFLPELRPVWNEVRTLKIDNAIVTLNRKKAESRNTMSVLGYTVGEELVMLVAPLITLCMISYLLVHILHIRSIADRHAGLLSEFPWMALFREWPARSLTLFSLLLFPLIANGKILVRAYDSPSIHLLAGLLLTVGSAAVGVFTLLRIAAIQRQYCCK